MVEIIPLIHKLFFNYPVNGTIKVLDVGPQTFSGTARLSRLHAPETFSNLKMTVSAVEIVNSFEFMRELLCPEVEFIHGSIADLRPRSWDLVIASHVVEHVENPIDFVRGLQAISSNKVIIGTPWMENPITTVGHVNTIDKAFVRSLGANSLEIFTNVSWGKTREVCIFTLDGKAPPQSS